MKLEPGEIICENCNGKGKIEVQFEENGSMIPVPCFKCDGTGKLTWIENVFGKEVKSTQSWMGSNTPKGYIPCDGRTLSKDDYPDLYKMFENQYGKNNL